MRLESLIKEFDLEEIRGEIEKEFGSESVTHICRYRGELNGQILLTNYRLIFVTDEEYG